MCDAINSASGGPSCDNLTGTNCGYCLDTDKAMYGDANGPIENVCQTKHWSAPGPKAAYECTKAREEGYVEVLKIVVILLEKNLYVDGVLLLKKV